MKTFSSQGIQLSASQRNMQAFQAKVRGQFLNEVLRQQTEEALAAAAVEHDKWLNKYRFDKYETDIAMSQLKKVSAFCAADCLYGYEQYQPCTTLGCYDHLGNFYPVEDK